MTRLFFPCFVPVLPCCRGQENRQSPSAGVHFAAQQHDKRRNTCANRKERMHQVERTCISLRQFRHNLVIVIGDGEMRERIDSYIKKLRIEPYIQIIPKASHEEVFGYISKSKAVVLLSRYEGQSMFITESLALGKPLVITKNNGMEHMVEEGVNGFLVETGDYKAAADILKNVMSISIEEINEMGIASKKKYDNNYSSKAVCDQFKDIVNMIY